MTQEPPAIAARFERCIWCNRTGGELVEISSVEEKRTRTHVFVHPEHREEAERFITFIQGAQTRFYMAFVGMFVVAIPAFVIASSYGERASLLAVAGLLAYLSATILVFPCATPQTIRNLGMKRSIQIVRALGVALLLFAAAMAAIALI